MFWNTAAGRSRPCDWILVVCLASASCRCLAGDLDDLKQRGVLRHLGVPYANFVTGSGDGLDVEFVKLFAEHLGVRYEYVKTDWTTLVGDLTGKRVRAKGDEVEILDDAPVRGDIAANGVTVLPWRTKVMAFSRPMFPTQVWLIARAESQVKPIRPSTDIEEDIRSTKALLRDRVVLGKENSCLDPALHKLSETGAIVRLFPGNLNELAPAVINGLSELTMLDVPDVLIALDKWPGKIKVIGPISKPQVMSSAFARSSPELLAAFDAFFETSCRDGTWDRLVRKYYPRIRQYYPEFFEKQLKSSDTRPASRPARAVEERN